MSNAADRARERALRFSAPGEQPAPEPARRPGARVRPVRSTVDLPPTRHHALSTWQQEQASMLGVARVSRQEVIDELVGLLLTDAATERKVIAALKKRFDQA